MSVNTYHPISDRAKAIYGDHDFEREFSAVDERDLLDGGHLKIVPSPYRVLSDNYSAGKQGSVVDLALPVEVEAALIAGGHLERVPESDEPAGNASTEEWRAYALKHGASEEEVADKGRDELRDKYAAPKNAQSAK